MTNLRTPEDCFATLPGFPWAPRYMDDLPGCAGLRMHYIDEGPADASHTFLCLHGEPSWAYLYRRMIPTFRAAGGRVIAPDFFGFGRSDKPADEATYTVDFHRKALIALVGRLGLQRVTLVVQDWGGLIGLTLPLAFPARIERLIVMNTMFATGESLSPGFIAWRDYVAKSPDLKPGALIQRGAPHLTAAEAAAYDAPFPDITYKAGVRRFPQLVPDSPNDPFAAISREARAWWTTQWRGKSFMAVGMADPVLGGPVMAEVRAAIRGCPPPLEIPDGGHFVQEWGERIADAALAHFARS
jgi:pimeloyl-ACP methyl ester carboxylesterase